MVAQIVSPGCATISSHGCTIGSAIDVLDTPGQGLQNDITYAVIDREKRFEGTISLIQLLSQIEATLQGTALEFRPLEIAEMRQASKRTQRRVTHPHPHPHPHPLPSTPTLTPGEQDQADVRSGRDGRQGPLPQDGGAQHSPPPRPRHQYIDVHGARQHVHPPRVHALPFDGLPPDGRCRYRQPRRRHAHAQRSR